MAGPEPSELGDIQPNLDILQNMLSAQDLSSLRATVQGDPYIAQRLGIGGEITLLKFLIAFSVFPLDSSSSTPGQSVDDLSTVFRDRKVELDPAIEREKFDMTLDCAKEMQLVTQVDSDEEGERYRMNEDLRVVVKGLLPPRP